MEIHQLEYFLAIAQYRSFSKAALEISVSQSTLSQQIQKLEEELGVTLFVREPRTVRLSPAGEEFQRYAAHILEEIQRCRVAMQDYAQFRRGQLRLGAIATIAYLGFHTVIREFIEAYPGVLVEMVEGTTDDLLRAMQAARVDAAFISAPFADGFAVQFYPLVEDEVVALLPAGHPLAHQASIRWRDLAGEKFLLLNASASFRNALLEACRASGFSPHILLSSNHEMVREFVEEAAGVCLMGRRIAQTLATPATAMVPVRPPVRRVNGLAVPRLRQLPPTTERFRDFVLSFSHHPTGMRARSANSAK
ncbi:MAG: LysR family transcriptional regulator [Firmicutes bacterium]|nr:LysR family transcriptional regulator [Alicyclobacillaceae bacterium]MCL6497617.1 LysR family transcriptional regulator [Bacillota bacterium]